MPCTQRRRPTRGGPELSRLVLYSHRLHRPMPPYNPNTALPEPPTQASLAEARRELAASSPRGRSRSKHSPIESEQPKKSSHERSHSRRARSLSWRRSAMCCKSRSLTHWHTLHRSAACRTSCCGTSSSSILKSIRVAHGFYRRCARCGEDRSFPCQLCGPR